MQRERQSPNLKRLLVVDDHEVVRFGVAQIVDKVPGLRVCGQAASIHDALEVAEQVLPDLAIVDISLGREDGLELVKRLRNLQPRILILVLSMHEEADYAERALRAGANGYMMKSETADTLVQALRDLFAGRVHVSRKMGAELLHRFEGSRLDGGPPLDRLTDRELQVFRMLGGGLSTQAIAEGLCISPKTVETHRLHIMGKLKIGSASDLVCKASKWVQTDKLG